MKFFIVLSSLLALTLAKPSILYTQPATVYAGAPLLSQYHSQDSLGQYTYGYAGGPSAKNEVRSLDGVTRGSYSYVDPEGKLQTVAYTADALTGFRVAASNLPEAPKDLNVAPEPVKDTPEVVKARAEHLAIVEQGGVAPLPLVRAAVPELEPVKETEEVAAARDAHLKAIEEAKMAKGPIVPEAPELKPIEETPEVKMAREEHLKSVENAKLRNAAIESVQDIRLISTGVPVTRLAVAQPTLIRSDPIVTKIEAPVTRIEAAPIVTKIESAPIQTIRLAQPATIQTVVPSTRFFEYKTAEAPYAYNWNIAAPDYNTQTIVNAGIPTGYTILDNGRLIRSVKNE
uniref:CSON014675 protein n=1 Tax=Culicoides sonorensis TaxID=179676 RepID=A0A336KSZ3_CULSO